MILNDKLKKPHLYKQYEEDDKKEQAYDRAIEAYKSYEDAKKVRNDAYDALYNREDFSYDVNKDAMYDKLVRDYTENASKAAEDAMGRAVAMTGGYGNSYAQQVSQQTFQDYMGGLDAEADKLYDRALDRYLLQGDMLKEKYDLATDKANEKYAEYLSAAGQTEKVEDAVIDEKPEVIDLDKYDDELSSFDTQEQVEDFLLKRVASGEISREKALELLDVYAADLPTEKDYHATKRGYEDYEAGHDSGFNIFGIDRNSTVIYTDSNGDEKEITLADLFRQLKAEGWSAKEARDYVIKLQNDKKISTVGKNRK